MGVEATVPAVRNGLFGKWHDIADNGASPSATAAVNDAAITQTITDLDGSGTLYIGPGTWNISSTIAVPPGVSLHVHSAAIIRYEGSGTAVSIVGHSAATHRIDGEIRKSVRRWHIDDTTSIGLLVEDCNFGIFHVGIIRSFHRNLFCYGNNGGTAYSTFFLKSLEDGFHNLDLDGSNPGVTHANENTFVGGRCRHNSNNGGPGTRNVHLGIANNNRFLGLCLEGAVPERSVYATDRAAFNLFLGVRWEQAAPVEFESGSYFNVIAWGYGNAGWANVEADNGLMVIDPDEENVVIGPNSMRLIPYGNLGPQVGYVARGASDAVKSFVTRRTTDTWWVQANGVHVLREAPAPAAPAADHVAFFARDNGSGKTQLCARFATGAIQVISTEP